MQRGKAARCSGHPVETCLRDEREARAQLETQWSRFAESNRNVCVQQTSSEL